MPIPSLHTACRSSTPNALPIPSHRAPFPPLHTACPSNPFTPHDPSPTPTLPCCMPFPSVHTACLLSCLFTQHSKPFSRNVLPIPSHRMPLPIPSLRIAPSHPMPFPSPHMAVYCVVPAEKTDFAIVWTESGCLQPLEGDVIEVLPASDKWHSGKRFGSTETEAAQRPVTIPNPCGPKHIPH